MNTYKQLSLLILCVIGFPIMSNQAQAIEEPEYVVVYEDGDIEFRQYQPYIVAETVVDGSTSYGRASNEGFMRLFRFITGNNSSQVDIDMTAPVQQAAISEEISMTAPVQRSQTDSGWRVAFMLPSEYSMETAPLPTDERVNLRTIPGRLMAVVRYSGRWTEKNYDKHENLLIDYVNANDLRVLGKPESAAYDAPYVLPFLRRNEVMIAVSDVPQMMQSNPEQ